MAKIYWFFLAVANIRNFPVCWLCCTRVLAPTDAGSGGMNSEAKRAFARESIYAIAWCISPPTNLIYLCAAFMFWQFVSFQLYHKCMLHRRSLPLSRSAANEFFRRETFSLAHCDFVGMFIILPWARVVLAEIYSCIECILPPPPSRKPPKIFSSLLWVNLVSLHLSPLFSVCIASLLLTKFLAFCINWKAKLSGTWSGIIKISSDELVKIENLVFFYLCMMEQQQQS